MNKFAYTALLTACFSTLVFATTTLSPNKNKGNGGKIPSGYDDLVFNVANGDWVANLSLPETAKNGAKVTVSSTAGYDSTLDVSNSDYPAGSISIRNGDALNFIFDSTLQKWKTNPSIIFTPKANGDVIPAFTAAWAKYLINDADWTAEINLPATAKDKQIILIQSDANKQAKIIPTNILFPSTFALKNQDRYFFQYNIKLALWVPMGVPTRTINVINGNNNLLSNALLKLSAPKTEVKLADGAWISKVVLPKSANDRDRIIVSSSATLQSTIDNTNINTSATLKLNTGDRYEFMYVADQSTWVLISSPRPMIQANEVATKLTQLKTPITQINADNASWTANIVLPPVAQNNDKVIVTSDASSAFNVNANGLSKKINKGDTYRFIYNNGAWQADTVQIDILLINSPEVDSALGATAAKLKIHEGIRITNLGLDNSQAKAYFREVGYLDYKIPAATLLDTLKVTQTDKIIQTEVDRISADAIHYQGLEPDKLACGWGYTNRTPNKVYMISSTNIHCLPYAISHEIGHNLGINHSFQREPDQIQWDKDVAAGKKPSPLDYNYGFDKTNVVGTFLSYNYLPIAVAYYSSPKVYDPKYGVRLGEAEKRDAVRVIDANAPVIANFRAAIN